MRREEMVKHEAARAPSCACSCCQAPGAGARSGRPTARARADFIVEWFSRPVRDNDEGYVDINLALNALEARVHRFSEPSVQKGTRERTRIMCAVGSGGVGGKTEVGGTTRTLQHGNVSVYSGPRVYPAQDKSGGYHQPPPPRYALALSPASLLRSATAHPCLAHHIRQKLAFQEAHHNRLRHPDRPWIVTTRFPQRLIVTDTAAEIGSSRHRQRAYDPCRHQCQCLACCRRTEDIWTSSNQMSVWLAAFAEQRYPPSIITEE